MRTPNSSIGRAARFLMLKEEKMRKDKQLVSGEITEENTNNGKLFTLMKLRQNKLKDSTKNMDSMSTDPSTSSLNFHLVEC